MAEEKGFEPLWVISPNGFQDRRVMTTSLLLQHETADRAVTALIINDFSLLDKREEVQVSCLQFVLQ